MKLKFNKFFTKKFISIFAAIAIVMTAIPLGAFITTAGAVANSDIIDFEGPNASTIVEGNDAFSITGQDSADKFYFYAKNKTSDILTITIDDINLQSGKQYTVDLDVYTLRVSKDATDNLFGLKLYGDTDCSLEKQIKNTDICEENWANYHTTFTAKEDENKLDFSIYTIGKVFIDNFVIIDENGKETAIDVAAACEATELKDHFSMATLYDIAYEEPDIIDGYLKADVPVNSNNIHNEGVNIPLNLDKPLDKGRYTVSVDLKFTSLGSCRDAFCASVAGVNNYDIIQQKWLNAIDVTLNKYATYTFELDLTPDHNLFRLNVYQGCTAYIDNLVLIDAAGIEVVRFDFDEPVNFEGSAFEQKGIARTQAASAALYSKLLAASNTASDATDPAYKMLFDKGEIFRTTNISTSQELTISFDYYLANGGVTVDDTYVDGYSTALKSGAVSSFSLTVPNSNQTHSFRFTAKSVTAELYIWNVKIAKSDSNEIAFENYTNRTTCDFTEITYADIPEMVEKNFVLLVDTTSVADDGNANKSFWFNELGMAGYGTLPNGTYTVQFDVCPITLAKSGTKFHFRTSNGQAEGAWAGFWQPELTVGEWTTTSSTFTVTDQTTSGNHILFVYGGFKGYIDNIVVLDSNGNKVAGTYTDIGGLYVPDKHVDYLTVDYIVVENEPEVELSDDYAIYQDSSAATTNYDTYFHCYDYSTYGDASKNLPAGEYKVTMDVYAQAIGDLVYKPIKDWKDSDSQKYWKPTADDLNKWVTVTYTGTTTTGANLHTIIYCKGFKGYVDNITVYSGETKLYTLSFTASENGKAGHDNNGAGVVGALPKDIADAKAPVVAPTTNDILLIDTTKLDNGTPTSFWFNELGMTGYGTLPNGTYTIKFDVYPLTIPTGGNLFHYRTGNGNGQSSDAGWWKGELTAEVWSTTSNTFTVKEGTTSGNHILYVYGGFKGYVDNIVIVDSKGNEVAGTYTDITGLTVPEKHKDLLKIETITTQDGEEAETNDVLLVDTTSVADDGSANKSFWFNELGMAGYGTLPNGTYTVKFDVCPITLAKSGTKFHFRTSNGQAEGAWAGFWKPELTVGEWTTTSSTFTVTDQTTSGNHILFVYGGFKGYIDNIVVLDSNGNEVAGTYTDITGLTVPEKHKDYLKIETIVISDGSDDSDDNDDVLSSGMKIAILRGRAGKNGASIKLGGAKSPLTIKSNTTYKLSFRYYQANPTNSGILNLFGIDTGFDNEITYFKKNNTTGWATGTVLFTTGDVTNAVTDWFEIVLSPNAWVYFDNFKLQEQEIDNNKPISVIDFEQKDDSIYPDATVTHDETGKVCTFGQTTDFDGKSNGSNGYFCATNAIEYTNDDKNSNRDYTFGGIKLKSNTTYRVSIDYYVAKPFDDYAFAVRYDKSTIGTGSGYDVGLWGNNKKVFGWNTESFVFTTGEVVPNAGYINLVFYDTPDSSKPRVMYFDNITFTELYRIESLSNDSSLGTVSSIKTVEAGEDSKVVANPYAGVTFEGWYEYGDLVSTDEIYRIKDVCDNHKLVAHFSGTPVKPDHIVQGFEDYDLGDILYEYYEIVDDPKNVLEGNQSLHIKEDKIEVNADHSVFFPLVSSVEAQLKEDTEYDVYIWVKPTKPAQSTTYFQIVDASGVVDMSDLLTSPGGTGIQMGLKPMEATALEVKDGWCKYLLGTVTKAIASRQGLGVQVCKFHAFRGEGASIDDLYVDKIELVEIVPDYANLKFTENLSNEITNSNFESEITNENWAPLTAGASVEKVTDKQYDWQGNYNFKFDAAKSNGAEYTRVIPIAKPGKNYTFAAWTKLSVGSDITVALYKNGNYEKFENIVNAETGKLGLIDDGKWNRVSFTFNSEDAESAYIVIKGTKGILELDMVELFIATRGYVKDPNSYGTNKPVFEMTNPIAFPDVIKTETTYVEDDEDLDDDTYIEETEDDDDDDNTDKPKKKKKKKRVVKVVNNGGTSPWLWVGIGAGALVVAAAVTIFIITFKKRKLTNKGGK